MEKVDGELEVFSSILMQEYIRLMTAAAYHQSEGRQSTFVFDIAPSDYEKMRAEPLQTALLGLTLEYDAANSRLNVTPEAEFIEQYQNAIMKDVAEKYFTNYAHRYDKFIRFVPTP